MLEINYFAVLVSGITAMILGGIWYGPLFGKLWMQGMGWDPNNQQLIAEKKKAAGPAYFQQFIGSLLTAYVFAHILAAFHIALPDTQSVVGGIQGAIWTWLGLVLPVKYGDKLWGGKKLKYVSIDLGYYLAKLIIMGIILTVWA